MTPSEAVLEALVVPPRSALGHSWDSLGSLLVDLGVPGPLGGLLCRLGAIWEPLGSSWAVGNPHRRHNPSTTCGTYIVFASSGSPGGPLGALLGSLGDLLGRLETVLTAS
eukprot:1363433-Pyramimonas_sp.AAC.1